MKRLQKLAVHRKSVHVGQTPGLQLAPWPTCGARIGVRQADEAVGRGSQDSLPQGTEGHWAEGLGHALRCCPGSVVLSLVLVATAPAQFLKQAGDPPLPSALKDVGIDQKLDAQIPLDLEFRDETGRGVVLKEYFMGKPVIIAPVYYECPMLCTQILNGLVRALKPVTFNAGQEFEVVAVSFNPRETPQLAAVKKENYLKRYGRSGTSNGWHFLTGEEKQIRALTDAIGFHYTFDYPTRQFAHASAVIVLTPQGKVSRYFYGVDYSPRDLRFGLVEASHNQIGTPVDQALLFCFHYDPSTGKYTKTVLLSLRAAATVTVLALGSFLYLMLRRERRAARRLDNG